MRLDRAAVIPASLFVLRELRYRGMVIGDRLDRQLGSGTLGDTSRFDQIQSNTLQPMRFHLKRLRRPIRDVNNPARNYRSAVVDPQHHRLPIPQISDLYVASDR